MGFHFKNYSSSNINIILEYFGVNTINILKRKIYKEKLELPSIVKESEFYNNAFSLILSKYFTQDVCNIILEYFIDTTDNVISIYLENIMVFDAFRDQGFADFARRFSRGEVLAARRRCGAADRCPGAGTGPSHPAGGARLAPAHPAACPRGRPAFRVPDPGQSGRGTPACA